MADNTVTEKATFGIAAADLRAVADIFDKVAHVRIDSSPWVKLEIQVDGTDQEIIERTDAVGVALFGRPGAVTKMSDKKWFYQVEGKVGIVGVHLYDSISEATVRELEQGRELAEKEAELARLRAEVEKLRADRLPAETAPEPLTPEPIAAHYDASAFNTESVCACGYAFGSRKALEAHVADPTVTDARLVDETELLGETCKPHKVINCTRCPAKPLISDETIAEAAAMEERDRAAGGPPWEVADHPDNAQPGGWHHGQIR